MKILKALSIVVFISFLTISCGDSGGSGNDSGNTTETNGDNTLSSGLKIFVSERSHIGDFANDPTLTGQNAIEKADFFCNEDQNKPSDAYYKALLVDGIYRDAISQSDWVLLPDTAYYRPYNNVEIDTTNSGGIFIAYWRDMVNSFTECQTDINNTWRCDVWTGIDPSDFSTSDKICNGWSSDDNQYLGEFGYSASKAGTAFSTSTLISSCNRHKNLYCVEQP